MSRHLVSLDNVQFNSRDYQHRAKVKKAPEMTDWITLPVSGGRHPISSITLLPQEDWLPLMKNKVYGWCGKHTYEWFCECVEAGFDVSESSLPAFNMGIIKHIAAQLDIGDVTCYSASALVGSDYHDANQNLINCLRRINSSSYICGAGSKNYLDFSRFETLGIRVIWHDEVWSHPQYEEDQINGLSILDAYRAVGLEGIKQLLTFP